MPNKSTLLKKHDHASRGFRPCAIVCRNKSCTTTVNALQMNCWIMQYILSSREEEKVEESIVLMILNVSIWFRDRLGVGRTTASSRV